MFAGIECGDKRVDEWRKLRLEESMNPQGPLPSLSRESTISTIYSTHKVAIPQIAASSLSSNPPAPSKRAWSHFWNGAVLCGWTIEFPFLSDATLGVRTFQQCQ